jgi:hypothetical protein
MWPGKGRGAFWKKGNNAHASEISSGHWLKVPLQVASTVDEALVIRVAFRESLRGSRCLTGEVRKEAVQFWNLPPTPLSTRISEYALNF